MRVILCRQPLDLTHSSIEKALRLSINLDGHICEEIPIGQFGDAAIKEADLVITYDISCSQPIMDLCLRKNVPVVYYDKGYTNRGWQGLRPELHYRFSLNAFHALHYFQSVTRPPDRWERLGIPLAPPQKNGGHIVFAGCSQGFANWHGFDITDYARHVIEKIRLLTDRPIVYRPKKSVESPPPIPGTIYSHRAKKIEEELQDAFALVTFSSNAAVDAILNGVPAFVLGPSIARPVSNTDLSTLDAPYFPSEIERYKWCCDLAYCQWRMDEIENGEAWRDLKALLKRPESKPPKKTVRENAFSTVES